MVLIKQMDEAVLLRQYTQTKSLRRITEQVNTEKIVSPKDIASKKDPLCTSMQVNERAETMVFSSTTTNLTGMPETEFSTAKEKSESTKISVNVSSFVSIESSSSTEIMSELSPSQCNNAMISMNNLSTAVLKTIEKVSVIEEEHPPLPPLPPPSKLSFSRSSSGETIKSSKCQKDEAKSTSHQSIPLNGSCEKNDQSSRSQFACETMASLLPTSAYENATISINPDFSMPTSTILTDELVVTKSTSNEITTTPVDNLVVTPTKETTQVSKISVITSCTDSELKTENYSLTVDERHSKSRAIEENTKIRRLLESESGENSRPKSNEKTKSSEDESKEIKSDGYMAKGGWTKQYACNLNTGDTLEIRSDREQKEETKSDKKFNEENRPDREGGSSLYEDRQKAIEAEAMTSKEMKSAAILAAIRAATAASLNAQKSRQSDLSSSMDQTLITVPWIESETSSRISGDLGEFDD